MNEPKYNFSPYKNLGFRLKRLRENSHQSLAEVSGAVEIDPDNLERIEKGERCPSEDVLLLLISHFDPQEDEAIRLWELAGYDQTKLPAVNDELVANKPIVMLLQPDNRIMYSDMVNVVANKQGLVMNFLQGQGSGQATPIARVGMSHEQAMRVFEALGQSLKQTQPSPRFLPAPKQTTDDSVTM